MGDFYEMFDDDAVLAHKALGITLTQRTEGVPMAGVPYHAVENYLRRMIEQGHRVAVCEQVQDAKLKRKAWSIGPLPAYSRPARWLMRHLLEAGHDELTRRRRARSWSEGDDSCAVAAVVELSTGSASRWWICPPGRRGRMNSRATRAGAN